MAIRLATKRVRRQGTESGAAREDVVASAFIDIRDDVDAAYLRATVGATKAKSARPWDWYEKIGEVEQAISRSARLAGYAELGAYQLGPDGKPGERLTTGRAAEIVAGIYSPYGGVRYLIDRFYTLMKVPADSYLIRNRDPDTGQVDGYDFISADEIDTASLADITRGDRPMTMIKRITLPARASSSGEQQSRFTIDIRPGDFLGRVWAPGHRFVDQAESRLNALDTECEVLHLLTQNMKSKLLSRFALGGILFLPSEISDVLVAKPGAPGEFVNDTVTNQLISSMLANVSNHGSAAGALPIILKGPGQFGEMIRHIIEDRVIDTTDLALRSELIDRILVGLDVQQNAVQGVGSQTNHWGAWAVQDEERRVAVAPDLEMMCWALTRLVLHAELMGSPEARAELGSTVVWYDLTDAATKANQTEDARQAGDQGTINQAAVRRMQGIPESDALTGDEYIRFVGLKCQNPYLAVWKMPEAEGIDWEAAGVTKPGPAPSAAPDSPVGPGVGQPGSPDSNDSDTPRSKRPQ